MLHTHETTEITLNQNNATHGLCQTITATVQHNKFAPVSVLIQLLQEREEAIEKHPTVFTDIIHAAAIVSEEAGELVRAAINLTYESPMNGITINDAWEEVRREALHTAVTALRLLENIDYHKAVRSDYVSVNDKNKTVTEQLRKEFC